MEALWDASPGSVRAVLGHIAATRTEDERPAYTTVMTVLSRLHDKGLVTREKAGRGYRYTPVHDERGLIAHLGQREVEALLDRYGTVALAQFAAALDDVDPEVRERIAEMAQEDGDA